LPSQFSNWGTVIPTERIKVRIHESTIFPGRISEDFQSIRVPVNSSYLASQKCRWNAQIAKFLLAERSFIPQMRISVGIEVRGLIYAFSQSIRFEIAGKPVILVQRLR
jgi:hypothetical protein